MHIRTNNALLDPFAIVALSFIWLTMLAVEGHQSISFPYPVSKTLVCAIRPDIFCPGPCPRSNLRKDMTPNNPAIVVKRGQWIRVQVMKNNHRGGFNRWSLVHVRDINNKNRHQRNTFLFTCGDNSLSSCQRDLRSRDCRFDDKNQQYRPVIQIPSIVPDGVYVLGWAWYGGLTRTAFGGDFGDYYDCFYLEIRGGSMSRVHYPAFVAGASDTKENGRCRATVNRLGACWKEPCPGGGRQGTYLLPFELDGRVLSPLTPAHYTSPYQIPIRRDTDPFVHSLSIRSVSNPNVVYASMRTRLAVTKFVQQRGPATITCEVSGDVQKTVFYVNGEIRREDFDKPYSIAGDWYDDGSGNIVYAAWSHPERRVHTVTCKAVGTSGYESWKTVQVSTDV